jgi:hypothetical protein
MTSVDAALDEALRRDLRAWVRGYHAERTRLIGATVGQAVERVFDAERTVLVALSGVLMLGIASIPWLGPAGVLGGLAILYVGTMVSAFATLHRVRALRASVPTDVPDDEVEATMAACPPVDSQARALLVRLMNLSTTRPTPRSRELLRDALAEAAGRPGLAQWRFLSDVAGLYAGPDAERVGPLAESPPAADEGAHRRGRLGALRQSIGRPR